MFGEDVQVTVRKYGSMFRREDRLEMSFRYHQVWVVDRALVLGEILWETAQREK